MSVSIGNDPTDESADARGVLASWLDDYTAGRCDRAEMQASFLEICRGNPEAPWDALALLDQYQRRGRVDALLARSLKSDIAQLVFGVANQAEDPATEEPPTDPDVAADSTGSRWRKILAERDQGAAAAAPADAFVDPTHYRRDFDPLTRPPQTMKSRQPAGGTAGILRERYELLTILGRGHSGTVYKALDRHRAHLNESERCVALRVLKLNYQDRPDALAELEREFHQAQSLSHPNIISMFDLDRDGGTYFMVMELLEGELLADILRRLDHRPMARERALSIIGSIGAALAHAHRRNIVHADLKPGKVMVTATGEVKVLDFGLAPRERLDPRRGEPWLGESDGATPTSTPAYASAERVNGEEPHSSEDVYSLACIAYELMAGHHPYGGRSAPLARAHGREPQRISGLSNRQWNVLRAALHWSRAERRIDVVELIAGLGCADVPQRLSGPEELLADDSATSRTGRKVVVWALLLAVAGVAGYLYWQNPIPLPKFSINPPAQPEPQAQKPVEVAPAEVPQTESTTPAPANESATTPARVQPPGVRPLPRLEAAKPAAQSGNEPAAKNESLAASANRPAVPPASADNAAFAGSIEFDKDTYVATESDGAVKLTVVRSGSIGKEAKFIWMVLPNSAEAGIDYADFGASAERIPAGNRRVELTVPLVSDAVKENTELFLVELSAQEGGLKLGERRRAAVILVDDD